MWLKEKSLALDAWLIDTKFQKLSDWSYTRFGISNFRLGQLCGSVALAFFVGGLVHAPDRFMTLWCAALSVATGLLILLLEAMERIADRFSMVGSANPIRMSRSRPGMIPVLVVLTIVMVGTKYVGVPQLQNYFPGLVMSGYWLLGATMYFTSCTKKPRSPLRSGNKLAAEVT